jgi:inorganic pyrophosphatase
MGKSLWGFEQAPTFELERFARSQVCSETHVAFIGVANKHRDSEERMVLACGVDSGAPTFLDFSLQDIDRMESIETIVTLDGRGVPLVRIWVRKGSLAFRYLPFVVEDVMLA